MNEQKAVFIRQKTSEAKMRTFTMCVDAGKGHLTSAYSCAEIIAVLYYDVMRHDPQNPTWENRDRFIMSKNHGTVIQYPFLADLGYFPEEELGTYMQDGGRLAGHSYRVVEGIDFSGGSLGIGLGVGAGLAYAAKMDSHDWLTFVLIGDGECYEGSIWEAAMFASHNKLGNLVAILDRNGLACTDFTESMLRLEPLGKKWQAFGWDVKHVDGHDVNGLLAVFQDIHCFNSERPLVIIAETVKGNGIDFMCNNPFAHGQVPTGDNITHAYAQLEGVSI
jgi:transketolase